MILNGLLNCKGQTNINPTKKGAQVEAPFFYIQELIITELYI